MRVVGSRLIGDSRDQMFPAQRDEILVGEYLQAGTLKRFSGRTLRHKACGTIRQFLSWICPCNPWVRIRVFS